MATVELKKVFKSYGKNEIVHGIDLDIHDNEFIVLVGPSGCGKSTTLRMIAGLEDITAGELYINGQLVNHAPPSERQIAMVFQNYALYPHMTVFENMAFGLRLKHFAENDIRTRVENAASVLGLTPYLQRRPKELSGGQRQRVAMGRAMVKNAEVYLFDEPLSNLDAKLRSEMRTEIKRRHYEDRKTTIYVTHDQIEAMTLADRLVIMRNGYIEQMGAPMDVYENPANLFVAGFIGSPEMNLVEMNVSRENGTWLVNGDFRLKLPENKINAVGNRSKVVAGIRPSDVFIAGDGDGIPADWKQQGRVEVAEPLGKNALISFQFSGRRILGEIMGRALPTHGEKLTVSFNLHHMHLFDPSTEKRLD